MRILGSLLLCSILLLPFATRAQVTLGVKAGPDFAWLVNAVQGDNGATNITNLKSGSINRFYGGMYVDIPIDTATKMFYFRPGIEYVGAGGNMNSNQDYYNSNGFVANTKYSLHYLDVPLEFVFSPSLDFGKPYLGVGVYAGMLMSGTIESPGSSTQPVKIGNNVNDNFQQFDGGYLISFGLTTKSGFDFGGDYQHGFIRTVPDAWINGQGRLQTHNAVWGIHVGWVFRL